MTAREPLRTLVHQFGSHPTASIVVGICVLLAIMDVGFGVNESLFVTCGVAIGPAVAIYAAVIIGRGHDPWKGIAVTAFVLLGLAHAVWLLATLVVVRIPVAASSFDYSGYLLMTGSLFLVAGACTLRSLAYCLSVVVGAIAAAAVAYGNGREVAGACMLHIGIAVGLALYVRKHPKPVVNPNQCGCGYDCTGVTAGVCPECGEPLLRPP